ncbi:MAG: SDR family oxidoreductase [Syntrophales bacterium LBB04]|nr:SDR family oxidoreductase [Syntrophales bacterium LBB04]
MMVETAGVLKLEGKTVIVTGAARGIGRAYALHLARLGANVVVSDINLQSYLDTGEASCGTAEEIRSCGGRALEIAADLTASHAVAKLVQESVNAFGAIDVLINNAGGATSLATVTRMEEDDWDRTVAMNLKATYLCCKLVAPLMIKRRSGKIINVSSLMGVNPPSSRGPWGGSNAAYAAAKAGIVSLTRSLALQLARYGITVNCVSPGFIRSADWELKSIKNRKEEEAQLGLIPLGRLGTLEEMARVIEFLATDMSDYMTGQTLRIDGGITMF